MKAYACIDLKSFYASVECVERGLNPLDTNLVVADETRTDKTICLAVTPPLKAYGLSGRCRLFDAKKKVNEVNYDRKKKNSYRPFMGKSYKASELKKNRNLELDFIMATPRMRLYMKYSEKIYNIYLRYLSSDDILVYSIDEIFCDITPYLKLYNKKPVELVTEIVSTVYKETGITATAGLGTNMYLAKVAMDISAKKMEANSYGVRIACLNEKMYKETLWYHTPITDFWRVGKGYAKKLYENGMETMGDVARMSIDNEDLLFKLFGVNAEFLIDHAWGYEPCTIKEAKEYIPCHHSISMGQVLHCPYNNEKTKLIVKEMTDSLVMDLVYKRLKTSRLVLTIIYDTSNLTDDDIRSKYKGDIDTDMYGRLVPKHSRGTVNIGYRTNLTSVIMKRVLEVYDRISNPILLARKIYLVASDVVSIDTPDNGDRNTQLDLFTDYDNYSERIENNIIKEKEENSLQNTILDIKDKFGKNSILRGMNFEEGATMRERNGEVGGHKG